MENKKIRLTKFSVLLIFVILLVSFVYTSSALATTGPIGYWKLDGNGLDSSGYGNHGSVSEVTWINQGKNGTPGTSASFQYIYSRVVVPHNPIFNVDELTIEAWINTGSNYIWEPKNRVILAKGYMGLDGKPAVVPHDYAFYVHDNSSRNIYHISFSSVVFGSIGANVNYAKNTWHHIAVTVTKSGLMTLYSDGKAIASVQGKPGVTQNTSSIQIGNYIGTNNWYCHHMSGSIDEVALYNRALSAKEIEAHYKLIPVVLNAETTTDGRKIQITFDRDMATPSSAPAGFTVTVNGTNNPITAVNLNSNKKIMELSLANTICSGQTVKLSYNPGTITSVDGQKLEKLTNESVTNKSTVPANRAPSVNIFNLTAGQKIRKSVDTFEFALKVTDPDSADKNLETEIYLSVNNVYQKVSAFMVNGTLNTAGKFTAANGAQYNIIINKKDLIPQNVNDFKLKVVAKDALSACGEKEVALVHFQDILARWVLDSIQEGKVLDASISNNHGTVDGALLNVGIINNALQFDGVSNYVSIPRPSFNNLSEWTFEAWVNPEGPGYIYSEGNPAVTLVMEVKNDNSLNIGAWHHSRSGNWNYFNSGPNVIKRNAWNHVVVTLANGGAAANSGVAKCYVNGVLVKSGNLGSQYNSATKKAALGRNVGYEAGQSLGAFKGKIDEVTLYGCALTDQEVLQKYHSTVFLDNIKITNRDNEETSAPCTFGTHLNKVEFELKQAVSELGLELELPSSIKIARVENAYIYNNTSKNWDSLGNIATVVGNKLEINQPLQIGRYRIDLLLIIDGELIIKTKSYHKENKININNESGVFQFEFMDFASLPNVT